MAKLTARFDLEDKISKKMKAVRGEVEAVEKARRKIDKPMVIDVVDKATRKIQGVNKATENVLKPKKMIVQLTDKVTKPISVINRHIEKKFPKTYNTIIKAQDKTKSVLENIRRYANRHLAKPRYLMVEARDRAMPTLHKIANYARRTLSKGYNFSVRAIDIATTTVGRIASFARTAIPSYRNFTVRAFDRATRIIGTIKRALFSIPTAITVALAVVGVSKLKDATVGASMNFEGYNVSMEHWLDGNKKQAQELVTWMGQFADKTPFSSPDLFPALARGVGLAGGDVSEAKQLLTIATNMAALTPGRTVEDAMEALGAAQMGEFQMLKGYNMKMTKDDYDDLGGWGGLIKEIDQKFAGGAEKLSATSAGIIATLKGYRGSILRSFGDGILDPMKPRLNAISDWLDNNQETWGRWKNTVKKAGEDASEWLFSKLENGFTYIRDNYLENDAFKKLDFEGKIKFIMDDLGKWWNKTGKPLLIDVSKDVGMAIYEGMKWGIQEGLKGLGTTWSDAIKDPSKENIVSAGFATVIAASIASLVLSPLLKGVSGIGKVAGGIWKAGKKVGGLFGKGKLPKNIPTTVATNARASRRNGKVVTTRSTRNTRTARTTRSTRTATQQPRPDYRQPWFGKGNKPTLNVPNTKPKVPKIPKGLTKLGAFANKIPLLGTLLGGIALATAPKEEKAGIAGGITGGITGAMTGAALGSIIPVIGTAIGGLLGGIMGSVGGQALGDWVSGNLESIKEGASNASQWVSDKWDDTWEATKKAGKNAGSWFVSDVWEPIKDGSSSAGKWIKNKFTDAKKAISDKWADFSGWFGESVWTPVSDAAINTMNFIVGAFDIGREWSAEKWADFSGWFDESVWTPVKEGAAAASSWISDRYADAKEWVIETWIGFSAWFDESVWTPVKSGAAIAGQWISDKYVESKEWISETWSTFSGWFDESVWTPIKEGAAIAGLWISDKYVEAKEWVSEAWAPISAWFSESVWEPIKEGAAVAGKWISDKYTEAKGWVVETWGEFSNWFEESVWTPVKEGARVTGEWIGNKFEEGVIWAKDAWGGLSDWFEESVWSPVKSGAQDAWGWIKGKWNDAKTWAGDITKRGEEITGVTPSKSNTVKKASSMKRITLPRENMHANGGLISKAHLGLVGEAGPEMIIPLSNARRGRAMSLYQQTGQMLGVKPYANGGMVGGSTLPPEQVASVISIVGGGGSSKGRKSGGIHVEITGDNHYSNDMDAEKVAGIAVDAIEQKLMDDYNEGGEWAVYE